MRPSSQTACYLSLNSSTYTTNSVCSYNTDYGALSEHSPTLSARLFLHHTSFDSLVFCCHALSFPNVPNSSLLCKWGLIAPNLYGFMRRNKIICEVLRAVGNDAVIIITIIHAHLPRLKKEERRTINVLNS